MLGAIVFFFLIAGASAEASVESLSFALVPEEESCQIVLTENGEELEILDKWAASAQDERDVALFSLNAEDKGLNVENEYLGNGEFVICVSGHGDGDRLGAAVFTRDGETVEIVWLEVSIGDVAEDSEGVVSFVVAEEDKAEIGNEEKEKVLEYKEAEETTDEGPDSVVTGNVIAEMEPSPLRSVLITVPVVFILGIIVAAVLVKRKRREISFNASQFKI